MGALIGTLRHLTHFWVVFTRRIVTRLLPAARIVAPRQDLRSWKMPDPSRGAGWQPASRMAFGSAGKAGRFGSPRFLAAAKSYRRLQESRDSSRRSYYLRGGSEEGREKKHPEDATNSESTSRESSSRSKQEGQAVPIFAIPSPAGNLKYRTSSCRANVVQLFIIGYATSAGANLNMLRREPRPC